MMSEQKRTQSMHALEDAIDKYYSSMQKMIFDVIASADDSKAIVELLTIFQQMTVSQLAQRGYIDMQRHDQDSPITHLIPEAHAD